MEERLIALLRLALKYNATDIHFMMRYQEVSIEMRIDGSCRKVKGKFDDYKLIRFLQYLANLDVGNILTPQTGQFEMEVDGNLLSLRFAVINKLNYTNGVLRILNSRLKITADQLSSSDAQNRYFRSLLRKNCGLVIFSGPTGSGKTTTLYSLLAGVRKKKIYSIEDPIEVYQDNLIQLSVNETMGFDYAAGVQQILAVVAANPGHLVLTSIHASKASGVISRMNELGVNEDHLYENLLCISNQRLFTNRKTGKKLVLYEIMDTEEIAFYRQNHRNSEGFCSIEKQIEKGIADGVLEKDLL